LTLLILRRREHVDAALLERLGHLGRRVGVLEREDLRRDVDERDLGAVGVEHVAELAAHRAGAHDEHRLGGLLQHEHVVARQHRRPVQLEPDLREPLHARPGGDDDGLPGLVRLGLAVGRADRDALAAPVDGGRALELRDLVLLEQEADALAVLRADRPRALHGGREVERDVAEGDAVLGGVLEAVGEVGALEQRLGGDAAPEHAGAAERLALDDGGAEAELGAADRADVPGGAAAEDDDVVGSHVRS
jgi:hypothetical protein